MPHLIQSSIDEFITADRGAEFRVGVAMPLSGQSRIEMPNQPSNAKNQVGPFVAGSTLSDLMALAKRASGCAWSTPRNKLRDPVRQRYQDLKGAAKEYFCDDDQLRVVVTPEDRRLGVHPRFHSVRVLLAH